MLDRVLRYVYLLLFFAVPLVMASWTSELFEFNKIMVIYGASVIVFFLWGFKMILHKKIILKKTPFDIPIILFLLAQILATIFSIDFHTSLFGYYGRFNGGLISIIAYLILYYGAVSNFQASVVKRILLVSLAASGVAILWALPGKFGHDLSCLLFAGRFDNSCWTDQFRPSERLFSFLGQPNWYAQYLLIHFFLALYFLEGFFSRVTTRLWFLLYLLLNSASILFTRSRSALAVLLAGIVMYGGAALIWYGKNKNGVAAAKKLTWLGYFCLGFLFIALIFKTGVASIDKYFTWPKKTATKKIISAPPTGPKLLITESLDLRKIVWQGALDLGKLHPLFGTGVETFAYSYFFVRPVSHNLTSEWDFIYNKAHNEYLNYLATTGFVGLFTYLFLIAVVLFHLLKKTIKKDKLSFYLFLAYCSILFTNFFGFATSSVTLFFYFIPAFWYISTNQGSPPVNPTPRRSFSPKDYMLSFIVLLVSVSLLWYLINYYRGDVLFAKANQQIKNENYPQAVQLLQRAIQLHDEHVYEDKYAFMLANTAYVAAYNKQDETAKQLMKLADYSSRKSIKASPENMNYWKTRSKIYYIFYQLTLEKKYLEEGVGALTQAKILAPSDPRPSYSLALYYSLLESEADGAKNQNMYRQLAFSEIDRALVLKPNYYEASLLKGQLLKKINQPEAARAVFQKMLAQFGSDEAILDELKSLYTTRK